MRFAALISSFTTLALGANAAAISPRQDTIVAGFTAYAASCDAIGISFPVSVSEVQANQCNAMPLENSYGSVSVWDIHESNPSCTFFAFPNEGCTEGTGVQFVPHVCVDAPGDSRWRAYRVECA